MQSLELAAEDRAELEAKVLAAAFKQSFEAGDSDGAGLAHTHLCAILQAREAATKANEFGQTERSKEISATIDRMHRAAVTRSECVLVIFRYSDKSQPPDAAPVESVPEFAVPNADINLEVKNSSEQTTEAYSTESLKESRPQFDDHGYDVGATSEYPSYFELDEPLTQISLDPEADQYPEPSAQTMVDAAGSKMDFEPEKQFPPEVRHREHSDTQGAISPEAAMEVSGGASADEPSRQLSADETIMGQLKAMLPEVDPQAQTKADLAANSSDAPWSPLVWGSGEPSPPAPEVSSAAAGADVDVELSLPPSEPGKGPLSYLDFGDTEDDTTPAATEAAEPEPAHPSAPEPEPVKPTPRAIPKIEIKVPVVPQVEATKSTAGATIVPEIVAPPHLEPIGEHAVAPGSFYEALGVGDTSTYEEIHTCFLRRLRSHIRKHHAHAPESLSRGDIKSFKEQLRYLCIAHDILKDPVTRTDYDLRRLGLRQVDGPEGGGRLNGGKRTALKIGELLECANIIQPTELQVALDMHKAEPNMPFGQFLLSSGFLSEEELDSAILGQKLITFGKITVAQFQTAISLQRKEKIPFFDTLVSEGWLTPADIFDESSELFGGSGTSEKPPQKPAEPGVPQIVIPEIKPVAQPQSNELDPVAFNIQMSWGEDIESAPEDAANTAGGAAPSDTTSGISETDSADSRGNGKTDNPARQSKTGIKKTSRPTE